MLRSRRRRGLSGLGESACRNFAFPGNRPVQSQLSTVIVRSLIYVSVAGLRGRIFQKIYEIYMFSLDKLNF